MLDKKSMICKSTASNQDLSSGEVCALQHIIHRYRLIQTFTVMPKNYTVLIPSYTITSLHPEVPDLTRCSIRCAQQKRTLIYNPLYIVIQSLKQNCLEFSDDLLLRHLLCACACRYLKASGRMWQQTLGKEANANPRYTCL